MFLAFAWDARILEMHVEFLQGLPASVSVVSLTNRCYTRAPPSLVETSSRFVWLLVRHAGHVPVRNLRQSPRIFLSEARFRKIPLNLVGACEKELRATNFRQRTSQDLINTGPEMTQTKPCGGVPIRTDPKLAPQGRISIKTQVMKSGDKPQEETIASLLPPYSPIPSQHKHINPLKHTHDLTPVSL